MQIWYTGEEFYTYFISLFMCLYIIQVLPIFPLKYVFYTKYFVQSYSINIDSTCSNDDACV